MQLVKYATLDAVMPIRRRWRRIIYNFSISSCMVLRIDREYQKGYTKIRNQLMDVWAAPWNAPVKSVFLSIVGDIDR